MALVNLTNFWNKKSIKLSDAFDTIITFEKNEDPVRLITCTGFTIPKIEMEEETLEYGNVAQVFLKPKYDACKEITLEFIETISNENNTVSTDEFEWIDSEGKKQTSIYLDKEYNILNPSCSLNKFFKYIGYTLKQKYGSYGLYKNGANYDINKMIHELDIKIMDNKLSKYVYKYHFENLKIVNYSIYNLSYQDESPCKISITLSFETYEKGIINELIKYSTNTEQENQNIIDDEALLAELDAEDAEIMNNLEGYTDDNDVTPPVGDRGPDLSMPDTSNQTGGSAAEDAYNRAKEEAEKRNQEEQNKSDEEKKNPNIFNSDESTTKWEQFTENGKTKTTNYEINYDNGKTVDATQNQQQYEETSKRTNDRSPSLDGNTYNQPNDEANRASDFAKSEANKREDQRKQDAYDQANKGKNRGATPPSNNVGQNNIVINDNEQFYKNSNNRV